MKNFLRFLFCGLCLLLPFRASAAIWGGSSEPDPEWEFVITPVMIPMGLNADVKVNGQSQNFDHANPADWVNYATRLKLEAWKGKLGILSDFHFVSLWDESQLDSATSAELNGSYREVEASLSYRFLQMDFGSKPSTDLGAEVYAGARAGFLNMDLNVHPGQSQSLDKNWIDPIIGERVILGVGSGWNFVLKSDVGGFGIGSASRLTWDFAPEIIFKVTDGIYVNVGYEIFDLRTEHESGNSQNELDARLTGPTLGLTFHFPTRH